MTKYFFFGFTRPDPTGQKRVTSGDKYRVEGGTKEEHEDAVEITRQVEEGVRMDGIHHLPEIMKDAVKKVRGT